MKIHINSQDRDSGTNENFRITMNSLAQYSKGSHRIALAQIDVPYSFYKIRENLQNLYFWVIYAGPEPDRKIWFVNDFEEDHEGNPTLSDVFTTLKAQMDIPAQTFAFSIDTVTGKVKITSNASFILNFTQQKKAGELLGFGAEEYPSTLVGLNHVLLSDRVVDLAPDKHLYLTTSMSINGDYTSENKKVTNVLCKIPVVGADISEFSLITYEPKNLDWKHCREICSDVEFGLMDMNNNPINLNGICWGFTLILD